MVPAIAVLAMLMALLSACASPSRARRRERPSFWAPVSEGVQPDDQTVSPRRVFRPDSRIRGDFLAAMAADPDVDVFDVRPEVSDGRIILHGETDSRVESARTEDLAKHIAGVRGVENDMRVPANPGPGGYPSGEEPEEARAEGGALTDRRVRRDVIDRLMGDGRVELYLQKVSVHGGVVTLSGITDYFNSKRWAAEDAREAPGVKKVINRISIRLPRYRPDFQLEREVLTALRLDPYFDPDAVHVAVAGGVVRLSGEVETPGEREEIVEKVSLIRGVIDVRDGVRVTGERG